MIRVIIAGEGANEVGGFIKEEAFRDGEPRPGAQPAIVGGVAIEKLESWLTALAGTHGSEALRRPEEILTGFGIEEKNTSAMVRFVEDRGLGEIPADARSLRRWLARAREALGEPEPRSDEPS